MTDFSTEELKQAISEAIKIELANRYQAGDVVATPDGKGVVTATLEEDFEFPVDEGEGDENVKEIEASSDSPVYVVGFGGKSGAYHASALNKSDFGEEPKTTDGETLATVSELEVDEGDLPEGWTKQSLLDFWESVGGDWTACTNELEGEFEEPERICSDRKSLVLGTERWRRRFSEGGQFN